MSHSVYDTPPQNPYEVSPLPVSEADLGGEPPVGNGDTTCAEASANAAAELERGALNPIIASSLKQTRPWTRLIGILLILAGLGIGIAGLTLGLTVITAGLANGMTANLNMQLLMISMILGVGVLYITPGYFLCNYSSKITKFTSYRTSENLAIALAAQAKFWRFVGIITATILFLNLLAAVSALVAPILS